MTETFHGRSTSYPIDRQFLERWSPRAFRPESLPADQRDTILEAARWAPSSYNSQPWRFLYAHRDSAHWPVFLGLLNPFNQSWAQHAALLVVVVSKETFTPPGASQEAVSHSHSFDAGAAWANLALQALRLGWHSHAMVGFDFEATRTALHVPEGFRIEAAIAIGRQTDKSVLPETLQGRETPNDRVALSDIAFEGGFSHP
jgi:nitroreductase